MKIRKNGQRNAALDVMEYTSKELYLMALTGEIVIFKEIRDENGNYKSTDWNYKPEDEYEVIRIKNKHPEDFRIFLEGKKEIKVVCRDGYYMTVVVDETGKEFYINLNL